jgi:molecular chaperone DnaK
VITVPAYFNDSQRQATKDAARIAGLTCERIINEPTAAALAYGKASHANGLIAVFDLGGGTFDVSILQLEDSVFEVRATNGDTFLGGEDFDNRIVEALHRRLQGQTRHRSERRRRGDAAHQRGLREGQTRAVSSPSTEITLAFIATGKSGPIHLTYHMTRADLEKLVGDLIDRLEVPCRAAMADAGVTAKDIQTVLLVGGMTRMPRVKQKVQEIFGKPPEDGINPDEVVAVGAAIQSRRSLDVPRALLRPPRRQGRRRGRPGPLSAARAAPPTQEAAPHRGGLIVSGLLLCRASKS